MYLFYGYLDLIHSSRIDIKDFRINEHGHRRKERSKMQYYKLNSRAK